MPKNRCLTLALAVLTVGSALGPAHAAQIFNFHYNFPAGLPNGFVEGMGTLTTTDLDPVTNTYTVVDITGTRTAESGAVETILALIAPGGYFNSNLLYASHPRLDGYGLSFIVDNPGGGNDGLGNVNVYYTSLGYTEAGGTIGYGVFEVSSATVPEPGAGVFLAMGLCWLAAGGLWRSRRFR